MQSVVSKKSESCNFEINLPWIRFLVSVVLRVSDARNITGSYVFETYSTMKASGLVMYRILARSFEKLLWLSTIIIRKKFLPVFVKGGCLSTVETLRMFQQSLSQALD